MLELTSKNVKEAIVGGSNEARSKATIAVSSAIGVGLVYVGVKKGGWWHIATVSGLINLAGNASSLMSKN